MNPPHDARAVRRAFDRAASTYDEAAALHHEVRRRLLERLTYLRGEPETILDLGAGTGQGSAALKKRYSRARIIAMDLSGGMLRVARRQESFFRPFSRVRGSAEALPLRNRSVDWCFSNLMLPWCDTGIVFAEVHRVLKPGGLFTFTSLGPDTLTELSSARIKAGDRSVTGFPDMHDVGDQLLHAGFAEPVMDVERIVLTYSAVDQLLREMKATGAVQVAVDHARHLGQRPRFRAISSAYARHPTDDRISATFEIVFGHAWVSEQIKSSRSTEAVVPLTSIGGRKSIKN